MPKKKNQDMRAVLDIETKPFSKLFQKAKSPEKRLRLAPAPTLACIYWIEKKKYEFFAGKNVGQVIQALEGATKIVTFNGEGFDFLVLERWCGLQKSPHFLAKSIDVCRIVGAKRFRFLSQPQRKGVNLDRCGKLNFGVPRKVTGSLKARCRAHVRLTWQIYEGLVAEKLLVPVRPPKDLPTRCPACEAKSEVIPFHPDYDQMTEGQIFDYEIGQQVGAWGFARCSRRSCRKIFTWGI